MRVDKRMMAPQLVEWLTSVRRDIPLTRLELGSLSAKDILDLVYSLSAADREQEVEQSVRTSAFRWSTAAGDEAMKVFATRDAIGHYEQAHQLVAERSVVVPSPRLHHLFAQLGRAYELRTDSIAAHAIYQTMLSIARQRHDAAMECTALNRLAA